MNERSSQKDLSEVQAFYANMDLDASGCERANSDFCQRSKLCKEIPSHSSGLDGMSRNQRHGPKASNIEKRNGTGRLEYKTEARYVYCFRHMLSLTLASFEILQH
jgi:hypothetical protein